MRRSVPHEMATFFQIIGIIASITTIAWFAGVGIRQIYESVVAGLIVQARWELAIDPTRRKLFRRAITIGLRKPDDWLYRHKVAVLSRVMRNGGAAQASLSAGDTATCDHAISGECISGTTRVPA
jgi:hypothetical protein